MMKAPKTVEGWLAVTVASAAGIVGVWQAVALALPVARSDDPPWAGKAEVASVEGSFRTALETSAKELRQAVIDAANSVRADDVAGRLFSRRSEQCAAIRERNMRLAATIGAQIQEMRATYLLLTGLPYELRPCDEF